MTPEEAMNELEKAKQELLKQTEEMMTRMERLQWLNNCERNGHRFELMRVNFAQDNLHVNTIVLACSHCHASVEVHRTNENNAVITPLLINPTDDGDYNENTITVKSFLNNKKEEE